MMDVCPWGCPLDARHVKQIYWSCAVSTFSRVYRHVSSEDPPCERTCQEFILHYVRLMKDWPPENLVQERDDLRKRTKQERLYSMRFNSFKSQLERERHTIAIQ